MTVARMTPPANPPTSCSGLRSARSCVARRVALKVPENIDQLSYDDEERRCLDRSGVGIEDVPRRRAARLAMDERDHLGPGLSPRPARRRRRIRSTHRLRRRPDNGRGLPTPALKATSLTTLYDRDSRLRPRAPAAANARSCATDVGKTPRVRAATSATATDGKITRLRRSVYDR